MAAVLKTARPGDRSRGFESHTLRLTRLFPGSGKIDYPNSDRLSAGWTQNGRAPLRSCVVLSPAVADVRQIRDVVRRADGAAANQGRRRARGLFGLRVVVHGVQHLSGVKAGSHVCLMYHATILRPSRPNGRAANRPPSGPRPYAPAAAHADRCRG